MKNIRNNVFETNSSSTHSISIAENCDGIYDTLPVENGKVLLTGGDFGWAWEKFDDTLSKANYAAQYAEGDKKLTDMLVAVIKSHTGAKEVELELSGYIDHQSARVEGGACKEAFTNKKFLKEFIFNPESFFITGNDNEDPPAII